MKYVPFFILALLAFGCETLKTPNPCEGAKLEEEWGLCTHQGVTESIEGAWDIASDVNAPAALKQGIAAAIVSLEKPLADLMQASLDVAEYRKQLAEGKMTEEKFQSALDILASSQTAVEKGKEQLETAKKVH